MSRADNTHHLRRAAADRNNAARDRARAAIEELDRAGRPVTFVAVARAATVSRSWLYNQPDLHAAVIALRHPGTDSGHCADAVRASAPPSSRSANVSTPRTKKSPSSASTTPPYANCWPGRSASNDSDAEPSATDMSATHSTCSTSTSSIALEITALVGHQQQ